MKICHAADGLFFLCCDAVPPFAQELLLPEPIVDTVIAA